MFSRIIHNIFKGIIMKSEEFHQMMKNDSFSKIKNGLSFLFDKYEEQFSKTDYPYFINDERELLEYDEYAIALENFCSNLDEFDIRISQDDLEIIKECANLMQLPDKIYDYLKIR